MTDRAFATFGGNQTRPRDCYATVTGVMDFNTFDPQTRNIKPAQRSDTVQGRRPRSLHWQLKSAISQQDDKTPLSCCNRSSRWNWRFEGVICLSVDAAGGIDSNVANRTSARACIELLLPFVDDGWGIDVWRADRAAVATFSCTLVVHTLSQGGCAADGWRPGFLDAICTRRHRLL